ncbi:MAG: reverse transcriptase domain-containing protein [Anaerolineae bacterium]|nr:reverse transcriptase domain-containing protein [Caldilineales bacterium]MCX7852946.1 reverse transcriptase domain-containing protein [Caldilineales bacterium]MDW8267870.1 reverse transcriptase domain-containing protein [Anaerolineae bacterium]
MSHKRHHEVHGPISGRWSLTRLRDTARELAARWRRGEGERVPPTTEPAPEVEAPPTMPMRCGPVRPAPPEAFFTPEAMWRAWRAVRAAGGGAGVDGQTLAQFAERVEEELAQLRRELITGTYRPREVRQVLVPKRKEGLRPLALWCLRDRIAQRVVYDIIAPSFEAIFLPSSFGFRPGLSTADAAAQVAAYRDQGLQWVVDADIESCFDSIPPGPLLELVRRRVHDRHLLRLIRGWLDARILNTVSGLPAAAVVAQGGVLSPLLANVYLHEFDRALARRRLALVRYADDWVVCCRRRVVAEAVLALCGQELGRLSLRLNEHKTRIVHFDQGFKFVGYFFIGRKMYRL